MLESSDDKERMVPGVDGAVRLVRNLLSAMVDNQNVLGTAKVANRTENCAQKRKKEKHRKILMKRAPGKLQTAEGVRIVAGKGRKSVGA